MTSSNKYQDIVEYPGADRHYYDSKIRLGNRLDFSHLNKQFKRHLSHRGFLRSDLIQQWEAIIGKIYADASFPEAIKTISNVRTLIIKVRYTRIIEFQHQKEIFLKQINLFLGNDSISDILFKRCDVIPKRRAVTTFVRQDGTHLLPHPKLRNHDGKNNHFLESDLEKSLNELAHIVMPIQEIKTKKTRNESHKSDIKSDNILLSWRDRAKLVLDKKN